MNCPQCQKPTARAARNCVHCNADLKLGSAPARAACVDCAACGCEMDILKIDALEIDVCPRCAAVWLDRGELEALGQTEGLKARTLLSSRGLSSPAKSGYAKCPVCMEPMLRRAHPHASRLRLASCTKHGIWFERDDAVRLFELVIACTPKLAAHTQKPDQRIPREAVPPGSGPENDWLDLSIDAISLVDLFDLFD